MNDNQNIIASLLFVMAITLSLAAIVIQQFILEGTTDYELYLTRWRWNNIANTGISLLLIMGSVFIHPGKRFIEITRFIQYLLVAMLAILIGANVWGISTNTYFHIGYVVLLGGSLLLITSILKKRISL
jgi:hypothetical protein